MIGQRWWEQALRTMIGPTIISSFRRPTFGNSVTGGCAPKRPAKTSIRYILATRRAVSLVLWSLAVSMTSACSTPSIFSATSSRSCSSSPSSMKAAMLSLARNRPRALRMRSRIRSATGVPPSRTALPGSTAPA